MDKIRISIAVIVCCLFSFNVSYGQWSSSGSRIYTTVNGDSVGIGTSSPAALLDVNGDALINGLTLGRGGGVGTKLGNTALGEFALRKDSSFYAGNTAIGYGTLSENSWGFYNTGIGNQALYYNTSGYANTAVGYRALKYNTTGVSNTAYGVDALYVNTTGWANVAIGSASLGNNTTGKFNSAVGDASLGNNVSGDANTAVGSQSLYLTTTGGHNTGVGNNSLHSNTIGWLRTAIGYSANSVGNHSNNSTGVGFNADPTGFNTIHIGNSSVTSIKGQVGFTTLSDERFKVKVKNDEVKGLDFVLNLEPVTYNYDIDSYARWKEENYGETDTIEWAEKYDIEKIRFSGFIAQDVEKLAVEIGYDFSGVDKPKTEKDIYGLRYAEFVVPLVKAVQEQQEQINSLQSSNTKKDTKAEELRRELNELREIVTQLSKDIKQCCASTGNIEKANSENEVQSAYLEQNMPNPFSESTIIRYFTPQSVTTVSIKLSSIDGTLVKFISGLQRGFGQVTIGADEMKPGTYIYELFIGEISVDRKRMIVVE